jgi:hypothetical protein
MNHLESISPATHEPTAAPEKAHGAGSLDRGAVNDTPAPATPSAPTPRPIRAGRGALAVIHEYPMLSTLAAALTGVLLGYFLPRRRRASAKVRYVEEPLQHATGLFSSCLRGTGPFLRWMVGR